MALVDDFFNTLGQFFVTNNVIDIVVDLLSAFVHRQIQVNPHPLFVVFFMLVDADRTGHDQIADEYMTNGTSGIRDLRHVDHFD